MAKDGIDLKVYLQPQLEDLNKIQKDLGETVKNIGDEKITKQFDNITQKIAGVSKVFEKDIDLTTFKNVGKEIQNIFNDIQKLTSSAGNLDAAKGFNELEQKILSTGKEIAILDQQLKKIKEGGKVDKSSKNFSYFATTLDERVAKQGFKREEGIKGAGTPGSQIKSYKTLLNYIEKAKEQGKTETEQYKRILKLIDQIKTEEAERTIEYKEKLEVLEKQKNILKETQEQAQKAAQSPLINEKQNDVDEKTIQNQQKLNTIYAESLVSKSKTTEAIKKGKDAIEEAGEKTQETSKDVEELTKKQEKQDGVIGKAVKNFTSYTLILGTMKRALRSAIQTIKVLDKSLTEQAMVAGRSRKELQHLLSTYQNIAKATGATTKEVAEVATQYFRQGKSAKEAAILTEAAVSAAKVGAISTADSVDYLTTAINGFGMAAEDASRVSDRFSALAASSATSYEELAVALSKVAAQAHLAGMSMDFTLGLLAKGIETTREAPETIGTALKTVIARMREMTDYGKTLEDNVSVNNLEAQLKYVGIQLRDNNGELRSSETVLDEVGRSWDSFNKNQQAALAKAFAGTRQQSRFIAMMQDYDRTLELVTISQQSTGATAAQMSTYMEGIEAALNKINVGWETLITTFVNSDLIVGVLNSFGDSLNAISSFFDPESQEGAERIKNAIAATSILLGAMFLNMAGARLQEKIDRKENLRLQQEQVMNNLQSQKQALLQNVIDKKNLGLQAATTKEAEAQAKYAEAERLQKEGREEAAQKVLSEARIASDEAQELRITTEETYQAELAQVEASQEMQEINKKISKEKFEQGKVTQHLIGFAGLYNAAIQIGNGLQALTLKLMKKQTKELKVQAAIKKASNPVKAIVGTVAGLAVGGIAYGIYKGIKNKREQDPEYIKQQQEENIGKGSAEAYKQNQKINKIKEATEAYEKYNQKVFKNKEEQDKILKQLDAASEVLTKEQKQQYDSKQSLEDKINYLKQINGEYDTALQTQKESLKLQLMQVENLPEMIESNGMVKAQVIDQIIGNVDLSGVKNKTKVYDQLKNMISGLSSEELDKMFKEGSTADINNLVDLFDSEIVVGKEKDAITGEEKNITEDVASVLSSDTATIKNKVQAYNTVMSGLSADMQNMFKEQYKDIGAFAGLSAEQLNVLSEKGFNFDQVSDIENRLGFLFDKKGYSQKERKNTLIQLLTGELSFNQLIEGLTLTEEELQKIKNIKADTMMGQSFEQLVQKTTSFQNKMKNIEETRKKWSTLTPQEQQEFIDNHREIFDEMSIEAFTSSRDISDQIDKIYEEEREDIEEELDAGIAAAEELGDKAEAEMLKTHKNNLKYGKKTFEELLKEEEAAVSTMRKYLAEQKDEEIKMLNEKKKAYEDYYAAINKAAEDQDYEEKRAQIATNISKLATSTDASALAMKADLEQQLKTAEKDRIEQLRQRSQEAVMESIDNEVERAQDELEDINTNTNLILDAIKDGRGSVGLQSILSNTKTSELEKESALTGLFKDIGSYMGIESNISKMDIDQSTNKLTFVLNNQEHTIDLNNENYNDIFNQIIAIMNSLGIQ